MIWYSKLWMLCDNHYFTSKFSIVFSSLCFVFAKCSDNRFCAVNLSLWSVIWYSSSVILCLSSVFALERSPFFAKTSSSWRLTSATSLLVFCNDKCQATFNEFDALMASIKMQRMMRVQMQSDLTSNISHLKNTFSDLSLSLANCCLKLWIRSS